MAQELIKLKVNNQTILREVEKLHAIRLLRLTGSEFSLPPNSPFTFENNELRRKRNKKADKG